MIAKRGFLSSSQYVIVSVAVFLTPFATFRFSEDLFFTVSDFFYCIAFVLILINSDIRTDPFGRATPIWLCGLILLTVGLLGSSLLNGDPQRGLIVIGQYLFSYFILVTILFQDERETQRLLGIFLGSLLLIDIHGIVSFYAVGHIPYASRDAVVSGGGRLATLLRNPNLAAAMNALTLPSIFYFWLSGKLAGILAGAALSVVLLTVVLTSSNSGLAAVCFSIAVFSAASMNRRIFSFLVCFLVIVTIVIIAGGGDLLPLAFQKRVLNALVSEDLAEAGTFVSRVELMREAIEIISDRTIFFVGLGADQFRLISAQKLPVHNLYLLLWTEGGVLGLAGWLVFIGVSFLVARAVSSSGPDVLVATMIFSTTAVLLLIAFSNAHMYARYWTTPLILMLSLGMARLRQRSMKDIEPLADWQLP